MKLNRHIKKVAVIGSGIMGSRIACHFANIGVEVLLLDIVPFDLTEEQLKVKKIRNSIVNEALKSALKSKPSPIYSKKFVGRINTGNLDDDLHKITEVDWIVEVVVERLDIKKQVFEKIEKFRTKGTLISSNTSGIPIKSMIHDRSDDFKAHFCGTHFFNPPRYLKLLEIIPTSKTKTEVTDFLMNYGDKFLGKDMVLCKDTPAFIANRIGVANIMSLFHLLKELDLTVEEVDSLSGPIIGRPKSATFRTCDLVGLDTLVHVANGVYENCPDDEMRSNFELPNFITKMSENNWLGRGITLQLTLNVSEEKLSGDISLGNPNNNYSDNTVFGSFSLASSDFTNTSGYKSSQTGISLGTEFEQYENIYLGPSISISNERIETDSSASSQLKKMDGTFTNLDFSYSITADRRNQSFQPSSGYRSKFLQTLPIVQDSSSILNGYELSSYKGFSDNLTGAVKFYARAIHGIDEDVRITNRFWLPAKKLKGFKTRNIGPVDGTDYVGGNYAAAINFDTTLPMIFSTVENVDVRYFIDTANLWGVDYSNDVDQSNTIRASTGVVIDWFTPIGPLNFSLAQDLSKADDDKTETFQFNLGTTF